MLLAVVLLIPSRQIAQIVTVKFPFTLPAVVTEGGVLTFPSRENDQIVRVGKESPSRLTKQNLYAWPIALKGLETTTVWSLSKAPRVAWYKREWLSARLEFSEQAVSLDRPLRVIASTGPANTVDSIDPLLARTDGDARLDCWKSPLPLTTAYEFKASPGMALKTAGAGEVVGAQALSGLGYVITVYHGDGLYTRYSRLHELQTHVGEKVAAGQMIGFTGRSARPEKAVAGVTPTLGFEVIWRGIHLNPLEVLKVSRAICAEPTIPLARTSDRVDRSPASKIYRWMSHQGRQ